MSNHEWHYWFAMGAVTTMSGDVVELRPVMRRRAQDASWQYRVMTPEEEEDYVIRQIW